MRDNEKITSLILPGGITSIGMRALSGCKNLKNVQLLSKLKSIGAVNADEVFGTSDVIAEFTSNQLHLRIKGERRIYDLSYVDGMLAALNHFYRSTIATIHENGMLCIPVESAMNLWFTR